MKLELVPVSAKSFWLHCCSKVTVSVFAEAVQHLSLE